MFEFKDRQALLVCPFSYFVSSFSFIPNLTPETNVLNVNHLLTKHHII